MVTHSHTNLTFFAILNKPFSPKLKLTYFISVQTDRSGMCLLQSPSSAQPPNNDGLTKQQLDLIHQIMQQTQKQSSVSSNSSSSSSSNSSSSSSNSSAGSSSKTSAPATTSTPSTVTSSKTKTWTVQVHLHLTLTYI